DPQSQIVERPARPRFGVRFCGIEHKRACDSIRKSPYCTGYRLFISRHAGDHQSAGDAVTVEFRYPDLRQLRRRARRHCPAGQVAGALNGVRFFAELRGLPRERLEKFIREEVNVSVAYFQIAEWSSFLQRGLPPVREVVLFRIPYSY